MQLMQSQPQCQRILRRAAQLRCCYPPALPAVADMELGGADGPGASGGVMAPIAAQADEPAHTKKKVADFLNHHTGAEGKGCTQREADSWCCCWYICMLWQTGCIR